MTMTLAAPSRRMGRPTNESVAQLELTARAHEAASLSAALRVIARGIEAFALDNRGDMRQVQWAERLRSIADQVDRRWEATR